MPNRLSHDQQMEEILKSRESAASETPEARAGKAFNYRFPDVAYDPVTRDLAHIRRGQMMKEAFQKGERIDWDELYTNLGNEMRSAKVKAGMHTAHDVLNLLKDRK